MIGNVEVLNPVQALMQIVDNKPDYVRRLGSPCRFTGKSVQTTVDARFGHSTAGHCHRMARRQLADGVAAVVVVSSK